MAKTQNKKQKTKKQVRKKFFPVEVPILNQSIELFGSSIHNLNNRDVKLDLTRRLRGKSIELKLKVIVENEKAKAIPQQVKLLSYYIKRMMRKGTDYVEDSFTAKSKDQNIRIKPFLITRRKVSKAVRKALRDKAKQELIKYAEKKQFTSIISDILTNQLQKELSLKLKKIYPLALCEIRFLGIEKQKQKRAK